MSEIIVTIPRTIGAAGKQLAGIDKLLTASQWERAAIVWAFTAPSKGGRPSKTTAPNQGQFSFREFARQGIRGLTKDTAVAEYHRIWQNAIDNGDAPECEPGDDVVLPTIKWPGRQDDAGQRRYAAVDSPTALAAAVNKLPDHKRDAFTQDLTRTAAHDIVQRTAEDHPDVAVHAVQTVADRSLATGRKPQPTRRGAYEDLNIVALDVVAVLDKWADAVAAIPNPPKLVRELVESTADSLDRTANVTRQLISGKPLSDEAEAWLAGEVT
jgi:hypothetical protein